MGVKGYPSGENWIRTKEGIYAPHSSFVQNSWLSGWNYRKPFSLSRASGAVTNYQVKLLLGESSGATGEDVDCGAFCLPSFNDVRFTNGDGKTLLPYWIESISGTTPNQLATIWIKADSIGTTATPFYMYYGSNSGTAAGSDGANTFLLFDDFPGSTLDTATNWTLAEGTVDVSSSHLVLTGTTGTRGNVVSKTFFPKPLRIRTKAQISITTATAFHFFSTTNALMTHYNFINSALTANQMDYWNAAGGAEDAGIVAFDDLTADNVFEKTWDTDVVKVYQNEILKSTQTTNIATEDQQIYLREGNTDSPAGNIDWIFVANFRSTEPTFGTFGEQESA